MHFEHRRHQHPGTFGTRHPAPYAMQRFRLLTEDHVKSLLPMPELIAAMEAAVARFSAGEVLQPVRTVLTRRTDATPTSA